MTEMATDADSLRSIMLGSPASLLTLNWQCDVNRLCQSNLYGPALRSFFFFCLFFSPESE